MTPKVKKEIIESAEIVEKTTMEYEDGWDEDVLDFGFEDDFKPGSNVELGLETCALAAELDFEEDRPESSEPIKKGKKNKALGKRGEDVAQHFLERLGYEILDRNWACVMGEADIVARDGDTLVFVEVKTRKNISKGMPEESISAAKRHKYECIAAMYLKDYDDCDSRVRFDVIGILVLGDDKYFIKHHINAFGAE